MEAIYLAVMGALGILSPIVSVYAVLRAVRRQSIDDAVARATVEERTAKDLESIKGNVRTICDRLKEITTLERKTEGRITAVEESAKSAHKRIDERRSTA